MKTKVCNGCNEIKELNFDNFHKDKNTKDGFYSLCKECKKKRYKAPSGFKKVCIKCNKRKDLTKFNNNYIFENDIDICDTCSKEYIKNMISIEKTCSKCKRSLPLIDIYFVKDKTKNDGRYTICKKCKNPLHNENKIEDQIPDGFKKCHTCKEIKKNNEDNFSKNKNNDDGLSNKCKTCCKNYYNKNAEKIKKRSNEYFKKNRDKLIKLRNKYYSENKDKFVEYKNKNKKRISINKKIRYLDICKVKSALYKQIIQYLENKVSECGKYLMVRCIYCGKWMFPTNGQISNRISAINGTKAGMQNIYCSYSCKLACPSYNRQKYPKGFKKETSREVQPELRKMRLEIDNYQCQICYNGLSDSELHCHHYEGINLNPIESADIDACITLCKSCHKMVHSYDGCKYNDMKCNK